MLNRRIRKISDRAKDAIPEQRAQSSWWTNYIVKLAYKRLFNINLDRTEKTSRRLLKNMQAWFDREKLLYPDRYVYKEMVADLIEHGSIRKLGLLGPVYSGKNEYRERIDKLKRYIAHLDAEVASLNREKRYTADLESILSKARQDLTELELVPAELINKSIEAETLLVMYRKMHNKYSIILTIMIITGMLSAILLSLLIHSVRKFLLGLYHLKISKSQVPV